MTEAEEQVPWTGLRQLLEADDIVGLEALLVSLPPGDRARALAHLNPDERDDILSQLPVSQAAWLLMDLPAAQAAGAVEHLSAESAAPIVEALSSQDQGDVLGSIAPEDAEAILEAMDPPAAEAARQLASYGAETGGGLMTTECLAFEESASVADVLDDLRANAEKYSDYDVQYAYVTDEGGRLTGVLRLRDLLLARPSAQVRKLMITEPRSVHVDDDLESLELVFAERPFLGVPVVGEENRLMGVVRRGDVENAHGERERGYGMKLAGIAGGEELRSLPTLLRSRRRLAWLSANVLLNVAAASVIAAYQDTLAAVIALAVFLPIISDMSGCSGSQAVAVTMRELSLGLVKPEDVFHVLRKEISVGLMNGVVLGAILAAVAWGWKGNPWLGLVVGSALAANTVVAVCIGGAVPLLLKRLGRDPALASGPILTTCTDMCGFLAVFGLATALLPRLVE